MSHLFHCSGAIIALWIGYLSGFDGGSSRVSPPVNSAQPVSTAACIRAHVFCIFWRTFLYAHGRRTQVYISETVRRAEPRRTCHSFLSIYRLRRFCQTRRTEFSTNFTLDRAHPCGELRLATTSSGPASNILMSASSSRLRRIRLTYTKKRLGMMWSDRFFTTTKRSKSLLSVGSPLMYEPKITKATRSSTHLSRMSPRLRRVLRF